MTNEEMKKIAIPIITEGFAKGKDEDDIKADLVGARIPFGKINTLFQTIAIERGLIIDPNVLKVAIETEVEGSDWAGCSTWAQVESFVSGIVEEVEGATSAKILAVVKKYCKENEIDLPEPVKTPKGSRAKGGKVTHAVVNLFNSIQKPTKEELFDVILPCVKGADNALYYVNQYHTLAYALGNSMTMESAAEETKDMTIPADKLTPAE